MKILALIIFLMVPFSVPAEDCEISGKAILWAYDACFWEYETDDSIHPDMMHCVNEGRQLIEGLGTCAAKRLFKSRICTMAADWEIEEIDPKTCLSHDGPLGPAVQEGGI